MPDSASSTRRLVVDLKAVAPVWRLPEEGAARIRQAAPADWSVQVMQSPAVSDGDGGTPPSEETLAAIREAEVYVGFGIPRALFLAAERLRWVHSASAGVAGALFPEMLTSRVLLTNSAGVHAVPMAEYALAGVLHFFRGLDSARLGQSGAVWDREPFIGEASPVRELGGANAVIIGTGGIGTAIAERFDALGVRCTGVRRRPALGAPPGFDRVVGTGELDGLLPQADIVVLAAPHTPETGQLLDARRLDLLPPRAVLVNVARGALVDEGALAERLETGRLRGAVLDVFDVEPLSVSSPLWSCSRALITPHISAVSPERFWERQLALLLENWERYRAGAQLRNLVDKRAGY